MMKKKIEKMTREDWEKVAACAKDMYLKSLDLHLLCSARFGKTHHATKRANRISEMMKDLKSEMDDLVYDYAQDLFNEKEISGVFYGD